MRKIIFIIFSMLCVRAGDLYAVQAPKDINPLFLNSLAIETCLRQEILTFGVEAGKEIDPEPSVEVQTAINKAVEYFFIGLALSDDKFWVDLNPTALTQVMDNDLAATGMGRVLLAADLRLKKDACELTNPSRSKLGRMYWDRLYAKADALGSDQLPVFNRVWIRPGEVQLVRTGNRITIAKSRLQVCFEDEFFMPAATHTNAKAKQLREYAGQLMRDLIIPELNTRVNESPYYADLRQVFNALILARKYKENADSVVLRDLDAGAVLIDAEKSPPLDKDNIYRAYIDSLKKGEYNFRENVSGRLNMYMEVVTRQYMSGGIDLKKIRSVLVDMPDRDPKVSHGRGTSVYLFDITLAAGTVQPLAAAKQQLTERFSGHYITKATDAGLSVDDLPSAEPLNTLNNAIRRQLINSQTMLINL
jgi:hypothetical protein